jgi:hypothetical protein
MNTNQAVALAQGALIWLASEPEELSHFIAATGVGMAGMRARGSDPEFLGFVLDFLLGEDARVLAVAGAEGVAPEALVRARAALPGGQVPDWT